MLGPGREGCSVLTTAAVNVQQQGWQDLEVGLLKFSILLHPLGHGSAVFWQQGLLLNLQLPIKGKKKGNLTAALVIYAFLYLLLYVSSDGDPHCSIVFNKTAN